VIAEHAHSTDLLPLSDEDRDKARKKGWQLQPDQLGGSCPGPVAAATASALGLQTNQGSLSGYLDKYMVQFLTGGWLEVFVWGLLSRCADALGIWDVRLGLDVGRPGDSSGNDYDVAFMRNYSLEMIECKSGAQEHDPGGEVLYKVEALKRQFGAIRVRAYLATTGINVLDKDGKIKSSLQNRADIYGCRILTTDQLRELAGNALRPEIIGGILFS